MPAEAGTYGVEVVVGLGGAKGVLELDILQVGIAVFDPGAQIVGQGIFEAATDRPAPGRVTVRFIGIRRIRFELDATHGETARRVDERAIQRHAGAQPERAQPLDILAGFADDRTIRFLADVGIAIHVGILDVALEAENEHVRLEIVAEMHTADEAVGLDFAFAGIDDDLIVVTPWAFRPAAVGGVQIDIRIAPGIAALKADIGTGPVIGGRRLDIGGLRRGDHQRRSGAGQKYSLEHSCPPKIGCVVFLKPLARPVKVLAGNISRLFEDCCAFNTYNRRLSPCDCRERPPKIKRRLIQ